MRYLTIVVLLGGFAWATEITDTNRACIEQMQVALERSLRDSKPPGNAGTHERYYAIIQHTLARLFTECAKRACSKDVRECARVQNFIDDEKFWRERISH